MNPDWFRKYMDLVAANIMDRDGTIRYDYKTLRIALDAVENNQYDNVPGSLMRLFTNIIDVLPRIELDDKQQVVLMLALLNCHMAYGLVSGYTLKEDVSVENMV